MNNSACETTPVLPATFAKADQLPERPERILVAEDEHLVATDLTLQLADLGYTVMLATNGQEAIHLAGTAFPDLAILDIRMPTCDGLTAAKQLHETIGVPSVIVSAYSDQGEVEAAADAGVFGYLIKPVQADQLRVTLEIAWRRWRQYVSEVQEGRKLRRRLEERKIVEQAKWILVSTRSMTEPEAMRTLQKQARDTRSALVNVAEQVVKASLTD